MGQNSLADEAAAESTSTAATPSWLDVIEDVMDAAMEEEEEYELQFEEFEVDIPERMGPDAERYRWGLDGTVRVRVEGAHGPLADWLKWWYGRLS
jgi:hypothetical protein